MKHLIVGRTNAGSAQVFSGGACNAINAEGKSERNTRRDNINAWLNGKGVFFFDPQIHETTHGRGYVYDEDGPAEKAARAAATVTLYEIGDDTLAAVTHMEALRDTLAGKNVVIWLTGAMNEKGKPVFAPAGDLTVYNDKGQPTTEGAVAAHLAAYKKAGTQIRQELLAFIAGYPNVTVVKTEDEAKKAIESKLN